MGHYASEMMCTTCGYVTCRCVPEDKSCKWLVDGRDLAVMTVATYDEKYRYEVAHDGIRYVASTPPEVMRWNNTLFDTREEALAHRVVVIDYQIERAASIATNANLDVIRLKAKKKTVLGHD